MSVQVIRAGSTVRVQIRPRSVSDSYVNALGQLVVIYSDGSEDIVGVIPYAQPVSADNIYANTTKLYANQLVSDFLIIQDQLVALENGVSIDEVYASSTSVFANQFSGEMLNVQNQITDLEA